MNYLLLKNSVIDIKIMDLMIVSFMNWNKILNYNEKFIVNTALAL